MTTSPDMKEARKGEVYEKIMIQTKSDEEEGPAVKDGDQRDTQRTWTERNILQYL